MVQHERHVVGIPERDRGGDADVDLVATLIRIRPRRTLALITDVAQQKLDLHRNGHAVEIGVFPLEPGSGGEVGIVDLETVPPERITGLLALVVDLLAIQLVVGREILQGNPIGIAAEAVEHEIVALLAKLDRSLEKRIEVAFQSPFPHVSQHPV